MTQTSQPAQEPPPPQFEEALAELENAVRRLDSGELQLSEALECFEHGVRHLKCCYQLLEKAERRVEVLCGLDAEGNPVARPFDDSELSLDEKQQSRSRRRSSS